MHVHTYFGLMIRMPLKMEKGKCSKIQLLYLTSCIKVTTANAFCYRVLLCLKRALRIANAAQQMASVTRGNSGPVTLFVEILNK